MKMNIPNKLSIARIVLIPVFMIILMLPSSIIPFNIASIVCAFIFIVTALTDMLDGKIARKYNLITDFGKFIDPLADKFMVIGASIAILYRYENIRSVFIWFLTVVIFRELAISSIRLIASTTGGVVIAASILGKIKTVSQIVCICAVLIEPLLYPADFILHDILPLTYISIAVATVFTVWSGINYIRSYWKFIDPQK